jgi:hypothetical protein
MSKIIIRLIIYSIVNFALLNYAIDNRNAFSFVLIFAFILFVGIFDYEGIGLKSPFGLPINKNKE